MTLGKLPNLSGPQSSHLKNGDITAVATFGCCFNKRVDICEALRTVRGTKRVPLLLSLSLPTLFDVLVTSDRDSGHQLNTDTLSLKSEGSAMGLAHIRADNSLRKVGGRKLGLALLPSRVPAEDQLSRPPEA